MSHKKHPRTLCLHSAEDLLIAGSPAKEGRVRAEGDHGLRFQAPEPFRLDGLHLQAQLLCHRPAIGALIALREAVENEGISLDPLGRMDALCKHRNRSRIEPPLIATPTKLPPSRRRSATARWKISQKMGGIVLVPRVADLLRLWGPVALQS